MIKAQLNCSDISTENIPTDNTTESCNKNKTSPDLELSPNNVDSVSEWLKKNYEYRRFPFSDVPYRIKLRNVYERYLETFRVNTISIKLFSRIIIGTFGSIHKKVDSEKKYKLTRLTDGMYIPHLVQIHFGE